MPSFEVYVKWGGKEHELEIDTDEPVEVFKTQLYTLTEVIPSRQKILVKGEILRDDTDLNTLDIKEGHTFMMVGTIGELPEESHQKTPFVEDMSEETLKLPPGLTNLGNTCYMNSTLQCLRVIPELQESLNKSNITTGDQDSQRNMIMSLCELYNQLNLTTKEYSPRKFLQSLQIAFPQFAERSFYGLMQQDAEECWSQIISSLSEINLPSFQNVANISAEEGSSTSSSTQTSFVEQYMTGEYTSILKCEDADAPNEEPVILHEKFRKLDYHISTATDFIDDGIIQALDQRLQKTSPTLNRQATYSKKSYISRLPSYLTVHFVRFFWKSQYQRRIKITRKIVFPFEYDVTKLCTDELKKKILPVKNQLIELKKERDEAKHAKNSDQMEIDNIKKNDDSRIEEIKKLIDPDLAKDVGSNFTGLYDLCAVLTHTGQDADSGHYMAWVCKDDNSDEWIKCDDDRVSTVKQEDILNLCGGSSDGHIAYILLYKSRKIE